MPDARALYSRGEPPILGYGDQGRRPGGVLENGAIKGAGGREGRGTGRAFASAVDSFIPLALVLGGVALVVVGLASRFRGAGPGRVPGDLRARRGPVTFYAPLGTSLLLSIILTVVLNLAFCASPR